MRRLLLSLALLCICTTQALAAGGGWSLTNKPTISTQASATQAPPTNAATTGLVLRLRSLQVSMASSGSLQGPIDVYIRDGQQGSGTIIWQSTLTALTNTFAGIFLTGLDIRSSVGSSIAVEFSAAGVANVQQTVNAQGDMVPVGYSIGGE